MLLLVAAMAVIAAVLAHAMFPAPGGRPVGLLEGAARFLSRCHLNRFGVPLWPEFLSAARRSLPLVGGAVCLLVIGSVSFAAIFSAFPRCQFLRYGILAASALPSFMYPFLGYLLRPERPFPGFGETSLFWGAWALAVGDLNLYALSSVAFESIRREQAQPYLGLLDALGRSRIRDLWPRVLISVLAALAARVPYLLGGTICLEMLYEIQGLGLAAWRAIVEVPADPAMLLWICVLGVLVSGTLSLVCRIAESALLPSPRERSSANAEAADFEDAVPETSTSPTAGTDVRHVIIPALSPRSAVNHFAPVAGVLKRVRYYVRKDPRAISKILTAAVLLSVAAGAAIWMVDHVFPGEPPLAVEFLPPGPGFPLGTDINGESVLHKLAAGFRQQLFPLVLSVAIAIGATVVPTVAGHLAGMFAGGAARGLLLLSWTATSACEFLEALPKLIVLLAAVSLADPRHLLPTLYGVMGVLFAPQMFRALADELQSLRDAAWFEAMTTMRIPVRLVLWNNLLRNHIFHVLPTQAAILVGTIIHADALIGFAGERKPGGVLTWGSILGFGTEQYLQYKPIQGILSFNEWVLLGPLIAVWLATVAAFVSADVLKILVGSYVHRR